ncbi:MAG: peptide deformylase [Thermodesulforhabdaceae bacterium]|jgi:peptide deformylase
MAILQIRIYPDPVLREQAQPIEKIDRYVRKLADDMADTMYAAPGIGLAANQVGILKRIIVLDLQEREGQKGLIVLVNPEIVRTSGSIRYEEGCLSVPGFFAKVTRPANVVVRGQNLDGKTVEIEATGLLAIALQHEIDHLNGRLFVDYLGPVSKELFKRKWAKRQEVEHAAR